MKTFTGEVAFRSDDEIYLRRKQTHVTIFYPNKDAPDFEKGTTLTVVSDTDFPKTVETINAYGIHGGPLRQRVLRGRYYLQFRDGIKVVEVLSFGGGIQSTTLL